MDLRQRVSKLSQGVKVVDAIDAHLRRTLPPDGDPEAALRSELFAIVELMFLMAAVDGEISEEEILQLHASIEALSDMQAIDGLEVGAVLEELNARLRAEGWRARLHSAASRVDSPEGRSFAFRLAAGVAFADDFVANAEAAAIESLSSALRLGRGETQGLLEEVHEVLFAGAAES